MFFTIEHAITEEEQTQGLMYRDSLPDNHGMLFSYEKPKILSFWSKNCLLDLDVAFLDADQIIREIHLMPAQPLSWAKSLLPSQYVLEMPAGFFEKNGIERGDQIVWEGKWARAIPHAQVCQQRS